MRNLHVLVGGTMGGVEQLCSDFAAQNKDDNIFLILKEYQPLIKKLENKGVIISVFFDEKDKLSICKVRKVFRYIKTLYNNDSIDAVIIHHPCIFTFLLSYMLKTFLSHLKVVIYIHAAIGVILEYGTPKYRILKLLFKFLASKVDRIIAISSYVRNTVIEVIPNYSEKVNVIYNGVNVKGIKNTKAYNPDGQLKFVFVGRLIEEKGVQNSIKLLSGLGCNNYRFDIIGDGPYKSELLDLVKELNMEDKVHFKGYKDNVHDLLSNYDVFIHLPVCEEGFGITIIEAMAAGLICIVNNKGALLELIDNEVNGLVLETDEGFCEMITKISNREYDYIQNNAMLRAHDFTINKTVEQLITLLEDRDD